MKLVALLSYFLTNLGFIRIIIDYLQFEFFKRNSKFEPNENNEPEKKPSKRRYTKTVFAKIPKQQLSPNKRKSLAQELELMNIDHPLLPELLAVKVMDMSAELYPDNMNFYYFFAELVFDYIAAKVKDLMNVELERVSDKDMIYIPIRVDYELFSDEELMLTCNFCEYNDIPIHERDTIFQTIWSENRMKYRNTAYTGETQGLYTSEIKSLKQVYLLVTDCLDEGELQPNAKWQTIPIVVNTYGRTINEVLHDLTNFPWFVHYKRKRWQIVYAATRPMANW